MSNHKVHEKANRLVNEKSPYLMQHAYNPVDWFPWSEEAFAKAREEDKPIFLSVGYSTCHWWQSSYCTQLDCLKRSSLNDIIRLNDEVHSRF